MAWFENKFSKIGHSASLHQNYKDYFDPFKNMATSGRSFSYLF